MSPRSATQHEIAAAREQRKDRAEALKSQVAARFEDVAEFLQEHLQVGVVFQDKTGTDTLAITHINWEEPIRQSFPGNADAVLFPPDFPAIPADPKKRGSLWNPQTKRPQLGNFESAFIQGSHHYDETVNIHYVVWVRKEGAKVQYQVRKGGLKAPNLKNKELPLTKFLELVQGWQIVNQE